LSGDVALSSEVWERARAETVAHLQQLIRIDTTNPPGNELALAHYLHGVLSGAGVPVELMEPTPGRAALVARIAGDGTQRPLLLLAHMDVVGVERDGWTVDPFAGEIQDGYLYGRGAIDDKGMLAVNLVTMLLLQRHVVDGGGALTRDVVLVATSDEEAGGTWGIDWLSEHHPEHLDAEYALNEGGRIRIVGGRPRYVAVQTAEKVPNRIVLRAHGPGGHAAVPLRGSAVTRLGAALAAVGAHREPLVISPTTRTFFAELAPVWPDGDQARAMRDLVSENVRRMRRGAKLLERIPVFDAILRNGISATVVAAGVRDNVIPTEATARLDVRTLPGEHIDAVAERLARTIDDPAVAVEVVQRGRDAPICDHHSPMFLAIRAATRALDPHLAVVPYLSTGATDSARLRRRGVACYGVLPFPLTQEDEGRMHGHDERVPLASLEFGLRLVHDIVRRMAAVPAVGEGEGVASDAHAAPAGGG